MTLVLVAAAALAAPHALAQSIAVAPFTAIAPTASPGARVVLQTLPITLTQRSTVLIRAEGRVDLASCTGAGCPGGTASFMAGTVIASLRHPSGAPLTSTSTIYASAISGGASQQGGRGFSTGTTLSLPVSISHVTTGVVPGSYQAAAELLVPRESAAHRFLPIQLIVEIWPEH